jgi:hypothetical protein
LNSRGGGYWGHMKFTLGFITGVAVGGFISSNMTEQQRAKTSEMASRAASRVQSSPVARSVTKNFSQVSGAASERVAGVVDTAGDALTGAIESSDTDGVDLGTTIDPRYDAPSNGQTTKRPTGV